MSTSKNTGLQLARDYFAAWSSGDVDGTLKFLADDISGTAPNGDFAGHDGYRDFIGGFLQMLTGTSNVTAFGDDTTAVMIYETHLKPVPTLVVAERLTIKDDKITSIEMTFDQTPLTKAFGNS
ncbi:nuclear transport factor 2 family protein [Rhodococcus erythropolis]|uniref:nuclear transport factor 2 family protein n=1 Tax=Rhodococcus erythropolis TaxID=1833 RepID=UPI00210D0C82|nr:nuclear transport factor 2 family protein [Rhodococcus erythropolis]MCQ4125246.1 nuclear transport factor 2 family protein [Rhodococcus erythropolis]